MTTPTVGFNAGGDPPPGSLITSVIYSPATEQTYNANRFPLAIMDGVNLTVAFQVPNSGRFYVDVTLDWAFAGTASLAAATDMFLGLVAHGNVANIIGQIQSWCGSNQPNFTVGGRATHRYYVSGQTPGPLQLDLAHGMSTTTNISFANFYAQAAGQALNTNPVGPAVIQVFAA